VPPITLWLIWRKRASLAVTGTHPQLLSALLLLAGAGFRLAARRTGGGQCAVAVCADLHSDFHRAGGARLAVARCIAFPLCFLLFAVPFGDFTQPKLMEWTAHFTVLGLRLTGIPVYSEGQHLIIPTGSWSVVEACSGVRYLIASVTVGTLFAYLTYHSLARRLTFVAISILVPIVANWGRAYMIVMLGHLSGNKLAVGVDHLIYGWVFFGIVIMAMFWIGARWREDELPQPQPSRYCRRSP
jgi:exosortase A